HVCWRLPPLGLTEKIGRIPPPPPLSCTSSSLLSALKHERPKIQIMMSGGGSLPLRLCSDVGLYLCGSTIWPHRRGPSAFTAQGSKFIYGDALQTWKRYDGV
uniref:Uncharacterized protein n=1 Tax=Triticum urartu TaxID=4572 RepID=A0A8R7QUX4_TRIUA